MENSSTRPIPQEMKAGHHQNRTVDCTGYATSEQKKWWYACKLLGKRSLKEDQCEMRTGIA
jgi:hypothetical protein